jgi:type III restriction enzyme
MINRLLKVESTEEPTEIVIHVNMLKEGWDVTNLYTIVPLRAANARTLIEQSIGRGLRLPYGKRTGVDSVDTLSIVAHDRFQESVDEAKRPDSQIRMKQIIIPEAGYGPKAEIVVPRAKVDDAFGIPDETPHLRATGTTTSTPSIFSPEERPLAAITRQVIRELERNPEMVPDLSYLGKPEVQDWIIGEVTARALPEQLELEGLQEKPNVAEVVAKAVQVMEKNSISVPRVFENPIGEVKSGFNPFKLDLSSMRFQPPSEDLWLQSLRTGERRILSLGKTDEEEPRPENYVVRRLVDFDDVSYEQHADLLYDLASQVLSHLRAYLSEENALKVMRFHQKGIAENIYAQMHNHFWEDPHTQYETVVSNGFEELSPKVYTREAGKELLDFRVRPGDLSKISSYLFTGFERCLTDVEKFQSNAERMLAVILDRDSQKWVRPSKNQPRIQYRWQGKYPLYQPDFIAETEDAKYILEPKASNEMADPEVLAKKDAAVRWCKLANEHAGKYGAKSWAYVLIPHDAIQENMTLKGLIERWQ